MSGKRHRMPYVAKVTPPKLMVSTCHAMLQKTDQASNSSTSSADGVLPTYTALSSKNHCCKLLLGLQDLRNNETLCDYSILAEGEVIRVHKAVMAACSDYFRVMLCGDMKESREGSVDLKGVTANGLRVVVEFAYTGQLGLTTENVEDVLSAATHLQVSDAVELCSKYLETVITVENCVDILNLSELYSLSSMRVKAQQYMLENFEIVAESEQYFKLAHLQLAAMLAENSLRVVSEYCLFELVLMWIKYKPEEREKYVADLMQNLRLPLLSGEELVEKVSRVELMKKNPECNELLTQAKDYHIVVSKQPLLQSSRTQVRSERKSLVMCHAQNLESYNFKTKRQGFLRDATIPLYNPCVVVVDNFMYACGGKYDSTENNEIATARCFRYDPRFDFWYELSSMNEARKDFVVVAYNGHLYAIAGQDENMVMCTVECFSIANNDWEMRALLSHSVYGHAGTLCQDKLYISGGQRFSGCCNNLACYTPASDSWEERAPMIHSRCNHVMVEVKDKLYVIGGNIEDSYGFPVPIIAIEKYCPVANQWSLCERTVNIREAGASVLDNKVYIVGGINGEHYYSDLLQLYDPILDEITLVEKFPTRIFGKACSILTLPQYI
ncbi:kelch-like protein 26 [Haliotis rubra]|uniref:kelch-like protein 26 n=1 Tax=Haliotis rubra TaxID=36100 RepID=UPI001EE54149|nr:kelch-like protein 26 [Haliotis rubra]